MARKRHEPMVDALPEHFPYRDTGCELSPSCLRCPLPQCKYDDPGWFQRHLLQRRGEEVLRVRSSYRLTVPQLADRFGLSQRTIHRILSHSRLAWESPEGNPPLAGGSGDVPPKAVSSSSPSPFKRERGTERVRVLPNRLQLKRLL